MSANVVSMMAPMTQEMMPAGPAVLATLRAPNSQPDPMMDPSDTNINP